MIDQQELERLTGGLRELRVAALQLFVEHTPAQFAQLGDPSPAVVAAAAHTALGSARTVAASPLAAALEQLVRACRAGDDASVGPLRAQALSLGEQTRQWARRLLDDAA